MVINVFIKIRHKIQGALCKSQSLDKIYDQGLPNFTRPLRYRQLRYWDLIVKDAG